MLCKLSEYAAVWGERLENAEKSDMPPDHIRMVRFAFQAITKDAAEATASLIQHSQPLSLIEGRLLAAP